MTGEMPAQNIDERFMRAALAEARKGLGLTTPNPAVGALLVSKNKIISRGHHRRAGSAHAEIECLGNVGRKLPAEATLYVTLEPCSTVGRTGACTVAIINSGVQNLVVGALDPNPKHAGRGIKQLAKAGLKVRVGILAEECAALNESYNKWIQTGLPFVIAKCGMSLDGRLTAPPGESRWLTSAKSRRHARRLRAQVDAILVGAETIRADDPRLTVRGQPGAKQPRRIVVSRSGKLPRTARVFTDRFADSTKVYGNIGLPALFRKLGADDVTSVLVEGGGDVLGQALDQRLIDKVYVYIAPIFTGGPTTAFAGTGSDSTQQASRLSGVRYEKIGADVCVVGYPSYDHIPNNFQADRVQIRGRLATFREVKMNWKKILLIAIAVGAFSFAAVPRSEAHVSVGIGFGFPIGFSYGYGYPYGYGYGYGYPYGYGYGYPRAVVYAGPRYYRHHRRYYRYNRPYRAYRY